MYPASIRDTYAQMFKAAEANLPVHVRTETIKVAAAGGDDELAALLKKLWGTP